MEVTTAPITAIANIHGIDFRLRENGGIVIVALENSNEHANAILSLVETKLNEKFSEFFAVQPNASFISCRVKNEKSIHDRRSSYTFGALQKEFAQTTNEYANQEAFIEAANNHLAEKEDRINAVIGRRANGPEVLGNEIAEYLQKHNMPICEEQLAKLKEFFTKKEAEKGADVARYTG